MKHIKLFEEFMNAQRFWVKSNYGHWSVVDKETNKMVVGYHKKEFATKTSDELNKITDNLELTDIIKKLKTTDGAWLFINEDLDATISDPEIENAWETIYGKSLKSEHPGIFKILKQRPPIDKRELLRIWEETYNTSLEEEHPKIVKLLFGEKKEA